ncbi:MAG: molybdopterin-synthase adenylyltransferase MoeB [Verrucomicrobiales bacterium]|nr:molybdopterin-synthase adenylyltransferase MoeB [Verrucomicrobiales bacterium]
MDDPLPDLTPDDLQRYARHLTIPEFGREAQQRLKAARVLCIGAGGLGSPISLYLTAAGIGTLGLVDPDTVDVSNLQRQILFDSTQVGRPKLEAAAERLRAMNPALQLHLHSEPFTAANARELASGYDLIIDGTDNFPTRYLSNDVAVWLGIPNVYGSILRFEGQVSVFAPHLGGPCYRCMAPTPPAPGLVPTCAEGGVLGVLPGMIGTWQALEAIKLLTGIGQPLIGRLLHVDALTLRFRTFNLRRDPECPVCGPHPSITEPIDYEGFCGVPSFQSNAMTSPQIPTITVEELQSLRAQGAEIYLLDVREPDEHATARIEGSNLIPLSQIPHRHHELPRGQRIVVHCKAGGRSAKAVQHLMEQGFEDVHNVEGGILAWSDRIDPKVPKY